VPHLRMVIPVSMAGEPSDPKQHRFYPRKSINKNCCDVYIMREMLYENVVNTACAFTGNIFWKRSKYCDMPQL
jgi:hypothetical protein